MSWTAKLTGATLDATGLNSNITLTITLTNDQTQEVQTRVVPSNGMNGDQLKAYALGLIGALNVRDGFFVTLQAAAQTPGGFLLAQG